MSECKKCKKSKTIMTPTIWVTTIMGFYLFVSSIYGTIKLIELLSN